MAEEDNIQDTPEIDAPEEGPGDEQPPKPTLSIEHRQRLANILLKMESEHQTDKEMKLFTDAYYAKYGQTVPPSISIIPKIDYRQVPRTKPITEGISPSQQTIDRLDVSQDPNAVARRQKYETLRKEAILEIESDQWKKKIFQGERPALTDYPDMPIEAFQKADPKAVDDYLATKDIDPANKYWLRNQILNYAKFRQSNFYVQQRAQKKLAELPADQQQDEFSINEAYEQAAQDYHKHETEAIANRLNNIGINNQPLRGNAPFHDQITGANKALMGAVNYAGDLGQQVSSLLEIAHIPGLSDLGYHLKTTADNLKARNEIPQTGEAGNLLAGEILPMALDMTALSRLTGAIGRPLYQSLTKARAAGTLGKFAEGAIGGLAVSPVNSYIIAHQYYNDLVKNGEEPGKAASKADQLLSKNMMTDMLILPLQMGLLKMPMGNWATKALTLGAEAGVAGTHFTLQDFNQKSTENPALHFVDYLKSGEYKSPFITGAILGGLQKAAVAGMENWSANSKTRNMFSYGRKYGGDVRRSLPSNESIASDVLSAFELKDTPRRAQELKDLIDSYREINVFDDEEAKHIKGIIGDVDQTRKLVPKFGSTEQRIAIFNELLNIRTAKEIMEKAGNDATEKFVKENGIKKSEERIQRILSGEEPLYFINGNETNKEQLLEALDKHPELLNSKGVNIQIRNDPETTKQIEELKNKENAIQKQSATTPDVRPASGDSEAMGGRNEGEGSVDQETAGEEDATEQELNKTPGADVIADEIETGKITDDHLLNVIKTSINEHEESLRQLREGNTTETGSSEIDRGPGQGESAEDLTTVVPETGERAAPDDENSGAESIPPHPGTPDEAGVVEQAGMPTAYIPEFYENDVKPALKNISDNIKDAYNLLKRAFDPRAGVSEKALTHIYKALGDRNQMTTIMDAGMKAFEKMFNKLSDQDRIDFIDNLKRGRPQATRELDAVAKLIRDLDNALYTELNKFKANVAWKENHFRVLWKVLPGSRPGAKEKYYEGRRPFEGTRGFLKRATLADISEGIARGGVPMSTNPITMFKIAYADGMKYITAQRMFEALKKDKLVKFVRLGQEPPEGFVQLNDRLAKVYFRTPGENTLQPAQPTNTINQPGTAIPKSGQAVYQGQLHEVEYKPGVGPVAAGEYWINKGAGRLLNNFLSRDHIRETRIGRGLLELKNIYTAAELGFSAFHAVAEGMEAISSQIGTGIRKMINLKDFKGGMKDILTSPLAPKTTASEGARAIKWATSEAFRNSKEGQEFLRRIPEASQYVDDFFQGGGLMKQHEDVSAKTIKMFREQFNKDNYIGAAVRALPAINDFLTNPLFQIFIPRLKVGMFFKEFPLVLQENASRLANGQVTRQELARKTVDFIDDRLGEMNFDNLFWNRTLKTAMQFFLRSVTWKLGSLRATWGVLPEQGRELIKAHDEGRRRNLTPKLGWFFGLTAMQVGLASIIQHMLAGKGLEDGKDIIAPQINPDDPNERIVMPTYWKDLLHQYHSVTTHDKLGYLKAGMAGQLSKVYDLWANKDFYGYEIRDQHAAFPEQAVQSAKYLVPKPFSYSSAVEMNKAGEPLYKQFMSFMGLQKAPGWLTHTELQNEIFELYNERNAGSKPFNDRAAQEAKQEIRRLFKEGSNDEAHEKLDQAIKDGLIRKSQVKYLIHDMRKGNDASVYFFSRLPFEDKKALYQDMDMEEKQIYDPKGNLKKQLDQMENAKEEE